MLIPINFATKKSVNSNESSFMQLSTVILIPIQWSNKSKDCQNCSFSTVFHPRELFVARRVTAGGSIPLVFDSDLRTMISFFLILDEGRDAKEGEEKTEKKKLN